METLIQIYVVFHKYLINDCYKDKNFDHKYFTFFKCNEKYPPQYDSNFGYNIKYEKDCEIYNPELQNESKPYMAVSAIYHIYKNNIYKKHNYIGFMEYDLVLKPDPKLIKNLGTTDLYDDYFKSKQTMVEIIKNICNNNKKHIIILSGRYNFQEFYNEKNMIDNINLFDKIINEFNDFYKVNHSVEKLLEKNPIICDQQSFMCDNETFETIMKFISHIIENKYVEVKGFRPSYLLARYIGVTLELIDVETTLLSLQHLSRHEWTG